MSDVLTATKDLIVAARAWVAMLDELGNRAAYNRPQEIALIAAVDAYVFEELWLASTPEGGST